MSGIESQEWYMQFGQMQLQQQNIACGGYLGGYGFYGGWPYQFSHQCPHCGTYHAGQHVCVSTWPAPAQVGWKCPNCGRGNAPFVAFCDGCAPKKPDAKP